MLMFTIRSGNKWFV